MSEIAEVLDAIRCGSDEADALLDGMYPEGFRRFRAQHATPIEVSLRAALWLGEASGARVLDVGAGAGRFCVTGALVTEASFSGVERRAWMVDAARDVAARLGAARADFVCGDIRAVDWTRFDGFYLFNPFGENYLPRDERIDEDFEASEAQLDAEVAFVEDMLHRAPRGTRVVTWNGFGSMLDGYVCARREYLRHAPLEYLQKE